WGVVTAVGHQLIHRHAPRHPAPSPPDEDIGTGGQRARIPIGVAHRHRGHPRVTFELVTMAVADALAGAEPLRHGDRGTPGHRRAQPELGAYPRSRFDPVDP